MWKGKSRKIDHLNEELYEWERFFNEEAQQKV